MTESLSQPASPAANKPLRVVVLSIVPSPYQRDLFAAWAAQPEVSLQVYYCEAGSPDSPWAERELRSFERVLPGFYLSWGGSRFLINRQLPDLQGVDLLVLNGYMTLAAQRLLRRFAGKMPVLFWAEKMVGASAGLKGKIQRWLAAPLRKLSGIVAIGQRAQRDYQKRYPEMPVYNLPYYCDLQAFEKTAPEIRPRQPVTLFFCGQMIARKGVDVLLQAFSRAVDEGLDARLLLVGRKAEIDEMLADCSQSARERVEYAGFQQPEDLPQFFAQADVFILPSRYDGWGVVVNQALGAGVGIICSDQVGAGEDLVEEGVNGFIFESGDVESLKACILKLAGDTTLLRAAAQRSAALAKDWSPEVGAQRWVEIVGEVCQKN